ncbi:MAG: hypothetical protein ACK4PR_06790 [Gammaproteobacteria bacterium]
MTIPDITHLCPLINHQIDLQENLNEHLAKVIAMTTVSLNDSFMDNHVNTINHYLLVLHDMVETARQLNELSLNSLLKLYQQISS